MRKDRSLDGTLIHSELSVTVVSAAIKSVTVSRSTSSRCIRRIYVRTCCASGGAKTREEAVAGKEKRHLK